MGQAFARMKFGFLVVMAAALTVASPQMALAQDTADAAIAAPVEGADAALVDDATATGAGSYTPMAPTKDKGMPTSFEDDPLQSMTFQDQYTDDGLYALAMHDWLLMPVITVISLFVLFLLLYAGLKFNRKANPVPSKTTHNTLIEVIWTIVPVIILVVIAVPSITLLARQYETPPADAITVKAVGYQWYWGYEYPDYDVEIVSNMLSEEEALASGEPHQLAVDNRMVVPVGVPLRIQTTAADVIHAFAVPSLWFKQDAVPGRLNERMLVIKEPGVYYGQCSELCGSLHGFMPIAVEALPMEQFEAWVASQGGTIPGTEQVAEAAAEAIEEATDADATADEAAEEPAA